MAIEISSWVEHALRRLLSLINDEMMKLAWNLKDDLQGIQLSTLMAIDTLPHEKEIERRSEAVWLWFIKLEKVAYEAEDVLNELSYEILRQKVHNNLGRIRFLKNVVFNSQLAQKVRNLNKVLQTFRIERQDHLRLLIRFSYHLRLLTLTRFRPCLGFCLSFPPDIRVQKPELIQLWMAAGLLQSYDEGDDLFTPLVTRSILKEVKDEDGNVAAYKVQGLQYRQESLGEYNFTSCVPYLYATTSTPIPQTTTEKLCSLILDRAPFQESWTFGRLRILVFLNSVDMEMLPSSIEWLAHLRYLDVSNTGIRVLPEFITKLYNLQTLKFLQCKELNKLPTQFNNLINLKNIAFSFEHQMPFGLGLLTCLETLSFFVVGSDRGGSIKELRYLNGLRGHLEMTRLEEVRDRKEAERANMQQKKKIDGLSFQWSYGARHRSSSDEKLLEGLQPHAHIQTMKIKYYMGENWPSWMLRTRYSSVVNNLVSLTLEHCWNCIQLPCLGDVPRLKSLVIRHMERVKCIYNEMDNDGNKQRSLFPALESLSLSWMENLTEWISSERPLDNTKVVVFPRLRTLSIQSCAKLTNFPVKDLSALAKIEIKDCDELRFSCNEQQSFPSLANLSIEGCPKLTHLRNWLLSNTSFYRFRVRRCEWLKFISDDVGLQSSLIYLELNCCKGLIFFSEELLSKLTRWRKLSIGAFTEKLDDFHYLNRIQGLAQLKELEIWGSDFLGRKMSHLPDQLQHLVGLKSLKIMGFTTMEALPEWLSDLQSLQCLSFNYCWHLECQSTVTIIQRLSNLKVLYIYGCHALEQNKSKWNEFSRITKITIQFSQLVD